MTLEVDHVACPCFDLDATHRFWTEFMSAPLVYAQAGESWLLTAYDFGGVMLDYFLIPGEVRPPSRGRDEIRHCGIAVHKSSELEDWKVRIEASGAETWLEDHGDDEHVYFYDPNGNLFELTAAAWTVRAKGTDPAGALDVVRRWKERVPAR
jgi:catechol 2,3-dioxygenase-like lactoylglutathione lyase family enzyme